MTIDQVPFIGNKYFYILMILACAVLFPIEQVVLSPYLAHTQLKEFAIMIYRHIV